MGPTVISGVRVAPNGEVLDSALLTISQPADNNLRGPDVAAIDGNYLVTWLEEHEDPHSQGGEIEGTWVQGGNGIVAPDEFLIADTYNYENSLQYTSVASNGERYLIAYNNLDSSADRIGARFIEPLYCLIDDESHLELMLNPDDPCEQCLPLIDETGWSERDCSEYTDQCNEGACDDSTGNCYPDPLPAGTPCDDGNPNTINDQCDAYGACSGEAPGTPDGDPATSHDFRAGAGGCTCESTGATASGTSLLALLLAL
jgi:hypothetical protein